MTIYRECCICKVTYGQYDVPEEGISHGLCEAEVCMQALINHMEAPCETRSITQSPSSRALSSWPPAMES